MPYYELCFWEDYRSHHSHSFNEIKEDGNDESSEGDGEFEIEAISDTSKSRYFLVYREYGKDELQCVLITQYSKEEANNILLQLHSHINGCGPFEVTGMTSSYKDTGNFSEKIPITHSDISNFEVPPDMFKPSVVVEVDANGHILNSLSILPFA